MAKYKVTSPTGETYTITAPDNATPEQVKAFAKEKFGGSGGGKKKPGVTDADRERALAQVAEDESGQEIGGLGGMLGLRSSPELVQVGAAIAAPFQAAEQGLSHVMRGKTEPEAVAKIDTDLQDRAKAMKALGEQHPLSRIVGAGTDVALGGIAPAVKVAQGTGKVAQGVNALATGGTYGGLTQPVTSGKDFGSEKAEQVAGGAATAGILQQGIGLISKYAPGLKAGIERLFTPKGTPPTPAPKPGAQEVTNELQAQRDVMEKGAGEHTREGGASKFERMKTDFDQRMEPMKQAAFNTVQTVDPSRTLDHITALEGKNVDKKVLSALSEVRDAVTKATENSGAGALPAAGSTMTAAQYKAMQGGSGKMSVEQLDEVRQSINRMIEKTGEGALDAHTKDILAQVRNNLMGLSTQAHRDWIAAERQGRQELERFRPQVSVLGKTTTDQPGAQRLTEPDAQAHVEKLFTGPDSARNLKQFVESTAHNPQAALGLRESFGKWLMPTNLKGKVDVGDMGSRWASVRDSVKGSGMFTPEHYGAIDKVMTDLAGKSVAQSKGTAEIIGHGVGMTVGRPGTVGAAARTVTGWFSRGKTPDQIGEMISKVMTDANAAQLAAATPTDANIQRAKEIFGIEGSREEAKSEPPRKRNVLGMRPAGI